MRLLIKNGFVIDPKNKISSNLNILIKDNKIKDIGKEYFEADHEIDAKGLIVCPGFVDIHMHEDPYDEERDKFDICIFESMMKMGVTTAIGGNCGTGPSNPDKYLEAIDRIGLPINFGLLLPHGILRKSIGENDKYKSLSKEKILQLKNKADYYIERGMLGISFGIRYIPGINSFELNTISEAVKGKDKIVAAHIRDDADNAIKALGEFIDIGLNNEIPLQVSHIGSMAAYGQMEEFISIIEQYSAKGLDIGCDCYPYDVFSTGIGEATYDGNFLERYNATYEAIEIGEGKYKGLRCNEEIFKELREENPNTITLGHVMKQDEVDMAIKHPSVMVASDGLLRKSEGHPRASGTFPRAIKRYVKDRNDLSLYEMIEKMTYMPAKRLGINKGSMDIGADGDIVIFDINSIEDRATFNNPRLEPQGIKYVLINGKIALKDNEIIIGNNGKSIKK